MTPKHSNYDRVCAECASYKYDKKAKLDPHTCTRPVELVTGEPRPIRCLSARSSSGHCGPSGRNFASAGVVQSATSKEREMA